jgi:hypothetical protein
MILSDEQQLVREGVLSGQTSHAQAVAHWMESQCVDNDCSLWCNKPECIRVQRDKLRNQFVAIQ